MSDSLFNKGSALFHAIAITTAIAILSGHLSPTAFARLQSLLPTHVQGIVQIPTQ